MGLNLFQHKKYLVKTVWLCLACLLLPFLTLAQTIKVAVAANLQGVIKVLQEDFTQKTGTQIEPIVGASGNLTNQIKNGAPFDVFLSADMAFPENLYKAGFSTGKPIIYALGSLIICSNQNLGFNHWEQLLQSNSITKIAIANPATAPYGKAATEVLERKGILQKIQPKIVYGESIAQVNIYLTTGVATVGFTTEALISDAANKQQLYWKKIDAADYQPIEQGMVILKHATKNIQAEQFFKYMQSASARTILKKYGYRNK
ncbi:molybdate ABC transporter substrate-binding protein [Mucilaginibacter arboris]|uniref:Molybdate ABC transporter substrate-binding protein n=1 Tax=Mucilaginibacter arboris TaxID=2682090 RepID=A0A7K1T1B5_9SPHI|nr:molybdate ABC transporter substrate-binding protein [Mucilaginibacter arboris]MVN23355.1 molybdate ABC transporter substrate-binding protein [Mucilaginibacter arboris]